MPIVALCFSNKGDFKKAIAYFDKAMDHHVTGDSINEVDLYLTRASAYAQLGKHDMVIHDATRALAIDPNLADAYELCGNAYFEKKGKLDDAIAYYSKSIGVTPGYGAYCMTGEFDKAIADFSMAIQIDRKLSDAYAGRAKAHLEER